MQIKSMLTLPFNLLLLCSISLISCSDRGSGSNSINPASSSNNSDNSLSAGQNSGNTRTCNGALMPYLTAQNAEGTLTPLKCGQPGEGGAIYYYAPSFPTGSCNGESIQSVTSPNNMWPVNIQNGEIESFVLPAPYQNNTATLSTTLTCNGDLVYAVTDNSGNMTPLFYYISRTAAEVTVLKD